MCYSADMEPRDCHDAFEIGLRAGLDPTNAAAAAGGRAVTSLRSPWLHRLCPRCGHTFRRGDPVDVAPDQSVQHVEDFSPCRSPASMAAAAVIEAEFFAGVNDGWPPPAGARVERLTAEHVLTRPPTAAFGRRRCAVCAHTLRPQDQVVICPCSPDAPLCSAAVHRDPAHQLHCWDDWQRAGRRFCPATSRAL